MPKAEAAELRPTHMWTTTTTEKTNMPSKKEEEETAAFTNDDDDDANPRGRVAARQKKCV